jgi:hypothetical protein
MLMKDAIQQSISNEVIVRRMVTVLDTTGLPGGKFHVGC